MRQFRKSRYWIGEDGEVWSKTDAYTGNNLTKNILKSGEISISNTIITRPEKWKQLNPHLARHDYYQLGICLDKVRYSMLVHRLVAEVYVPGYFKGAHVDHIDNNPYNNHYTNLQWCTKAYNQSKRDSTTFPLYIEWSK